MKILTSNKLFLLQPPNPLAYKSCRARCDSPHPVLDKSLIYSLNYNNRDFFNQFSPVAIVFYPHILPEFNYTIKMTSDNINLGSFSFNGSITKDAFDSKLYSIFDNNGISDLSEFC